jgi:hypothetical protein
LPVKRVPSIVNFGQSFTIGVVMIRLSSIGSD